VSGKIHGMAVSHPGERALGAHRTGGCVDLRSHPDSMDNRKPLSPAWH